MVNLEWDMFVDDDSSDDEVVTYCETQYAIYSQDVPVFTIGFYIYEIRHEDSNHIYASYYTDFDTQDCTELGDNFDSIDAAKKFCEDWLRNILLDIKSALAEIN